MDIKDEIIYLAKFWEISTKLGTKKVCPTTAAPTKHGAYTIKL